MNLFLRRLLFLCSLLLGLAWPGLAAAQSACTALWGTLDVGGTKSLRFYNTTTNRWVTTTMPTLAGNSNGLAGDPTPGYLYYVNRTGTPALRRLDLNAQTDSFVGNVPAPPATFGVTVGNIVGATVDTAGNYWVYASNGVADPANVMIAQLSTSDATTVTSWMIVRNAAGTQPAIAGSGDIYTDNGNVTYILSNTTPPRRWTLGTLTPGVTYPQITATAPINVTNLGANQIAGVAVDPVNQAVYFGTGSSGSVTYALNLPPVGTGTTATLEDNTVGSYVVSDMGNCVQQPARPTVSKSFSPSTRTLATNTTTLQITIGNSNTVPVWLMADFTDSLPATPAQMVIATPSTIGGSCVATGNTISATAGGSTLTFAAGGRIPAGGCTISVGGSASAVGDFVNSIPAGTLNTTAGTNAAAATATFSLVAPDFALAKAHRTDTSAPFTSGALSVTVGQTFQYQLTIGNLSGTTGTATFVDTLPALATPVLAVSANQVGGGSCTAAQAVVGGATQVTGTVTSAPVGSTCTVLITATAGSNLPTGTPTRIVNTATVASDGGLHDSDLTNNSATVTTTISPIAPTVTKSFNPASAGGGTSTLTLTFGNANPVRLTLTAIFRDLLPTSPGQMRVYATPSLQGSCITTGNPIPAGAKSTSMTFAAGGFIPPGGCTLSFVVDTPTPGDYLNTIPAGSLTTGGGSNATDATATFTNAETDFAVTKLQRIAGSPTFTTGAMTVTTAQIIEYQLNIGNVGANPGTVTFIDTLPANITPVNAISVSYSGGGSCTTATAIVTGQTRVSGTVTGLAPGTTCTVLINAHANPFLGSITTVQNTVTIAAAGGVLDFNAANNGATVTTTITPAPPTVSKFFSPSFTAQTPGTGTLYIVLGNSNPAAITLTSPSRLWRAAA